MIRKKIYYCVFSRQGDYYSDEEEGGGGGDVRWLQQDEESDLEAALDWSPQFETESQEVKVELGHTIRLPCRVDRLGESMGSKISYIPTVCNYEKRGKLGVGAPGSERPGWKWTGGTVF